MGTIGKDRPALYDYMNRLSSAFRRDTRGGTAVEFAIVAPLFLFTLFVIAQSALILFAGLVMDNAVEEVARLVRTGQIHASADKDAAFRKAACDHVRLMIDCDDGDFYIVAEVYSDFRSVDLSALLEASKSASASSTTPSTSDFGGPNDIVVIRAYKKWSTSAVYGALSFQNTSDGKRLLSSFKAFRNESFAPGLGG